MIVLIDYGAGNLHSVAKAFSAVGAEITISDDSELVRNATKLVLPGVGAFGDGMKELNQRGLVSAIKSVAGAGKPLLGICLGMQLLFERSEERGDHSGLGLLQGRVTQFVGNGLKVPQIGWNQIEACAESILHNEISSGSYVYFNHGYHCVPSNPEDIAATTNYGVQFASMVAKDNVFGVQFHPEKSQQVGLSILKNFVEHTA